MFLADFDWSWLFIAVALGLLGGMFISKRNKYDKAKIAVLPKEEFFNTMRKGTLIDTRKAEEYDKGKILGAKNFPNKTGVKDSAVRKDIPIFIYDEKGGSKIYNIAKSYVKKGAVMVYILKEGYESTIKK